MALSERGSHMQFRLRWTAVLGVVLAAGAQTPTRYSFTELNSLAQPNLTVKVYRDGPRELIDQSLPLSEATPKGMHAATLYDFRTHKSYTWDLIDRTLPCNVADYFKTDAPAIYDVISGAQENHAEIAKLHPKAVVDEVVNGIPASRLEVTDSTGQVTVRLWTSTAGGYLVKWLAIPKVGLPQVRLEVTALSFERPRAALLSVPAKCAKPAPRPPTP